MEHITPISNQYDIQLTPPMLDDSNFITLSKFRVQPLDENFENY